MGRWNFSIVEKGCLSQSEQHGERLTEWGEVNEGIQAQW